jgi:hypothetical protein
MLARKIGHKVRYLSPYVNNPVKACLVTFPGSANLTTSPNSHLQYNVPVIDVAIFYDNHGQLHLASAALHTAVPIRV